MREEDEPSGSASQPDRINLLRLAESLGPIETLIARHDLSVNPPEDPADRQARLAISNRAAWLALGQDAVVFLLIVVGLVILASVAYQEAFNDVAASSDTKRWALAVLTSVVTGGVSFVAGRKIGGK